MVIEQLMSQDTSSDQIRSDQL